MFATLYSRLVWLIGGLFLLLSIFLVGALQYNQRINQDLANQRMHQNLAAHIAKDLAPWPNETIDKSIVKDAFHVMMILGPAIELYVTDLQGQLLAYDAQPTDLKRMQVDVEAIQEFLVSDLARPIYGVDPRSNESKVFSATQLRGEYGPKGYLYIIIGGQEYDQIWSAIKANQSYFNLLLVLVLALFILFVVMVFLLRFITFPVNRLIEQMSQHQAQKIHVTQMPLYGSADIQRLQKAFYSMAQKIDQQFAKLQLKDQLRKDMLVQISHDLKTPIAAQQAYLETLMLHQGVIGQQKQQEFIESAFKNSELLKNRVHEILQLTRLEQGLVELRCGWFELSDFVLEVYRAVEPLARKNNTQLVVPTISGRIYGDAQKLNRVLVNLLENAISHCANGRVEYLVKKADDHWYFSVSDDGPGIPIESQAQIFNPYFRSRPNDTAEHLGLGLAICQRIVALHGASIKVKSELGEGTCFYFKLRQVDK